MSTFEGTITEFPDLQIDYFRRNPSRPALAFFLSHVHSDHLQGLDSFKGTFIYCSLATREILLRLEKYPHRMNFTKGILESRVQSYKHLKSLLKPLPLETPTIIELSPGRSIRVTTFDANHCTGAVMFLIEGHGKAILYTGDIRSEAWWVNSICRSPTLLPYVVSANGNSLKRLDKIYLDTTFSSKKDRYRDFPSKADGITELLRKVSNYPNDTAFYFDSWTFGYEAVWQALSNFLSSQIHVDEYRYKLYLALANTASAQGKPQEAFQLIGSSCGNHFQEGCLTTRQTRLHSCEQGANCEIWNQKFVRITPVVSHFNGVDIPELGAGGGLGDLKQQHILELGAEPDAQTLIDFCSIKLSGQPQVFGKVKHMLQSSMSNPRSSIQFEDIEIFKEPMDLDGMDDTEMEAIPLSKLIPVLAKKAASKEPAFAPLSSDAGTLPQRITFPYSRHSSYHELCLLIEAFRPRDIHPCTVDKQNWDWTHSMSYLFGHVYGGEKSFKHDTEMLARGFEKRQRARVSTGKISAPELSASNIQTGLRKAKCQRLINVLDLESSELECQKQSSELESNERRIQNSVRQDLDDRDLRFHAKVTTHFAREPRMSSDLSGAETDTWHENSAIHELDLRIGLRQEAYDAALGNEGASWFDIGLVSVHGHQEQEEEL